MRAAERGKNFSRAVCNDLQCNALNRRRKNNSRRAICNDLQSSAIERLEMPKESHAHVMESGLQ